MGTSGGRGTDEVAGGNVKRIVQLILKTKRQFNKKNYILNHL